VATVKQIFQSAIERTPAANDAAHPKNPDNLVETMLGGVRTIEDAVLKNSSRLFE